MIRLSLYIILSLMPVFAYAEGGMPQLKLETYSAQIFWLCACFIVLYIVMSKRITPEISEMLNMRAQKIANELRQAEELSHEAESLRSETANLLDQAHQKAHLELAKANEKTAQSQDRKLTEFNATIDAKYQEFANELANERAKLLQDIANISTPLCQDVIKKIGHHPAEKSDIEQTIKTYI